MYHFLLSILVFSTLICSSQLQLPSVCLFFSAFGKSDHFALENFVRYSSLWILKPEGHLDLKAVTVSVKLTKTFLAFRVEVSVWYPKVSAAANECFVPYFWLLGLLNHCFFIEFS